MTLEDETGFVNLVIWQNVFEKYNRLAKTVSLLAVQGEIQNQEGVTHLVVQHMWSPALDRSYTISERSRDFH